MVFFRLSGLRESLGALLPDRLPEVPQPVVDLSTTAAEQVLGALPGAVQDAVLPQTPVDLDDTRRRFGDDDGGPHWDVRPFPELHPAADPVHADVTDLLIVPGADSPDLDVLDVLDLPG